MSKLAHSDDVSTRIIEAAERGIKIETDNVFPPIPTRGFDWCAVDGNTYDGDGCPIGHGATELEAIDDLLEKLDIAP